MKKLSTREYFRVKKKIQAGTTDVNCSEITAQRALCKYNVNPKVSYASKNCGKCHRECHFSYSPPI